MPKVANYPRKPFDTALEIAESVEKLGGKCSVQILSDKLGKNAKGGSFSSDINAAVKHGLISKEKDTLRITDLFKNIKLSYTDEEKNRYLVESFLLPDTYREILTRFSGKEIPIDVLGKMLIKEYDVTEDISQSVANNLIKGSEKLGLIQNNKVNISTKIIEEAKALSEAEQKEKVPDQESQDGEYDGANNDSVAQKVKKSIGNNPISNKDVVININIQLTVPETTNEEVYEKFFAAMKKHLLS